MKNLILPTMIVGVFSVEPVLARPHAETEQHHADDTLTEVIISASPLGELSSGVNKATSLLTGDALRNNAAASLGETLENERGVTNSGFGPGVGRPIIRGQSDNRVRVLQDSLGSLDTSTSSADHAISIEPLLAERIEILRGPATLRYGNGAIGGVVNVLDNRISDRLPETTSGAIELRHNTVNDQNNSVFLLEGGAGRFAWHLDGLYRDSNRHSFVQQVIRL